jgi:hypothetical protein
MNDLTEVQAPSEPMGWLERIIDKGVVDAASLEKLIDLKQRMEDRIAKQAFATAMNRCQQALPRVITDKENNHTRSRYVQLETLQDTIMPTVLKHGFALSWSQRESSKPGMTIVLCTLYHGEGHSHTYEGEYPIDGKGASGGSVMNPLQGTVSAHTYAQKDMLRLMWNITIADQDRDGETGFLDSEQIKAINSLIEECNDLAREEPWKEVTFQRFMDWAMKPASAEGKSLDDVPATRFTDAINFLNARRKMPKPAPKKGATK